MVAVQSLLEKNRKTLSTNEYRSYKNRVVYG